MAWVEPLTVTVVFTAATREAVATARDATNAVIGTANARIHVLDHLGVMGGLSVVQTVGTASQKLRVVVLLGRALLQQGDTLGVTRMHCEARAVIAAIVARVLDAPTRRFPNGDLLFDVEDFAGLRQRVLARTDANGNVL